MTPWCLGTDHTVLVTEFPADPHPLSQHLDQASPHFLDVHWVCVTKHASDLVCSGSRPRNSSRPFHLPFLKTSGKQKHCRTLLSFFLFSFFPFFLSIFGHARRLERSQFPDQGWNPCLLQWKCGVLTTGPPGNPPQDFQWLENEPTSQECPLLRFVSERNTWPQVRGCWLKSRLHCLSLGNPQQLT